MKNQFREQIEDLIEKSDLHGLHKKSGELHGHFCNYLTYGVIAGLYALKKLNVSNTGMEEVIAIVETNNCFVDGIQMVTGCTLGNNALIYRDYGKTAVTISKRDGNAIRLVLKPSFDDSREKEFPDAYELFYKLVARREQGTPEEYGKMMQLFSEMSIKELNVPVDEMFNINKIKIQLPDYAPIFETIKCSICGENVMKTRIIEKDNKNFCIPCANAKYFELNGSGIVNYAYK
ncbi:MAG: TraR/DksA C4-type zinc finger protein [Ignavibacteriales bacterium]|nr:TraR/DksA C4-type zinc finger protein [Ignavibacteriales bacterium]